MMRLIALLLSFYVLFLTALPCADVVSKGQDTHWSKTSDTHDDADHCSPFCTCNCCATAMQCSVHSVDFEVVTLVREQITLYPNRLVPHRFGDIWQPPQLS